MAQFEAFDGGRTDHLIQADYNPFEDLFQNFIEDQFGRGRGGHRGRGHRRGPSMDEKAYDIASELDYGRPERAAERIDKNIERHGTGILNRIQNYEQKQFGSDLNVVSVRNRYGENGTLARIMFPADGGLVCKDIGVLFPVQYYSIQPFSGRHQNLRQQYQYRSLMSERPYYCY